ncbi:MAG: radical SAM-associated putative lipoprotein [Paludibacter sp.]|nr:radical SAM-associated putative lipoprotein [Paludibacter sp.]
MKKKILLHLSKVFTLIVASVIFISCNTNNEIGTSNTMFVISGTVTDSVSSLPINGIKLVLTKSYPITSAGISSIKIDTVFKGFSDALGTYKFQFLTLPPNDMTFKLNASDIDAANNGSYNDREVTVLIESFNWDRKASDVSGGRVTKTQNVKLLSK